jgi:hypothetical protein
MDTIATAKLFRQGGSSGGSTWHERHSIDFVINGQSLFSATRAKNLDMCGRFSSETLQWNEKSAQSFLLEGEADEGVAPGRFMIFVCSECGDLGCGAITCEIIRDGECFVWRSFAYENGYDPEMTDFDSYSQIGPFRFPQDEYRFIIRKAENTEQTDAANHHAYGTFGTSPAEQALVPKASGDT